MKTPLHSILWFISFTVLPLSHSFAQSSSLTDHLEGLRYGQTPSESLEIPQSMAEGQAWSDTLALYITDTSYVVKSEALRLVEVLPSSWVSPQFRKVIVAYIQTGADPYEKCIRLAGRLDLREITPVLIQNLLASESLTLAERWATWIVLARLGNPEALGYLQRNLAQAPMNDEMVEAVFPDLVYTRQRVLLDVVVATVQSDEQGCNSANTNRPEAIPCAYRAMEYLPDIIDGFPYQRDVSGDLAVEDYENALKEIRMWLEASPNYTIKPY